MVSLVIVVFWVPTSAGTTSSRMSNHRMVNHSATLVAKPCIANRRYQPATLPTITVTIANSHSCRAENR